jgi:hypothetical protein
VPPISCLDPQIHLTSRTQRRWVPKLIVAAKQKSAGAAWARAAPTRPAMTSTLKKSDERMLERRRQQTQKTENVRVVCRLRPLLEHELDAGAQDSIQVGSDNKSVHVHVPEDEPQPRRTDFQLDEVIDGSFDQEATFDQSGVKDLLDSALEGFSATVFAYGQTGSGKTYTMAGQDADAAAYHPACFDGVIPRAVRYIFEQVEERRATAK